MWINLQRDILEEFVAFPAVFDWESSPWSFVRATGMHTSRRPIRDTLGNEYKSITEASRELGIHSGHICRAIKNHKTVHGIGFEYI